MEPRLRLALARAEELAAEMSNPDLARDPARIRTLGREHARLEPVVRLHERLERLRDELSQAEEMSTDADPEFAAMARADAERLRPDVARLEAELHDALLPRDPLDDRDAILEIRAGTGGDEAGLFAGELVRLYTRFAERHGLTVESISYSEGNMGGLKEAVFAVRGADAFGLLRRESGVHRVQRVPATETQGRIHTSAATVAVLPEAEEIDVKIDPQDLKIDVFRSSGPGGQSVNTTDSAVRITHLPTGLVVSQQDQKSQLQNKLKAMEVLRARLLDRMIAEQEAARASERRAQVGTGDRSAKIRTYNFPQSRVTDHRINVSAYDINGFMDGRIDDMVDALRMASREETDAVDDGSVAR
jgi:peptide chain release factor 1